VAEKIPTTQSSQKRDSFLPLELFDPSPEGDPAGLLDRYRDPADGKCYASSRWVFPDGRAPELRRCEVLEYLPANDYYSVRWLHNSRGKKASRFNLIFEREDQERLEARIVEARRQREVGDLMMRFHYMLEHTKAPGAGPVPDQVKTRISYRVLSHQPLLRILEALVADRELRRVATSRQPQRAATVPQRLL